MADRRIEHPGLYKTYLRYALAVLAWECESCYGRRMTRGDIRRAVRDSLDDLTHNSVVAKTRCGWLRRTCWLLLDGGYLMLRRTMTLVGIAQEPRNPAPPESRPNAGSSTVQ